MCGCIQTASPFGAKVWETKGVNMLSWAATFLIIALIAGALGFGGVAGTATGIAQILFTLFIILFFVSLLLGRRVPPL